MADVQREHYINRMFQVHYPVTPIFLFHHRQEMLYAAVMQCPIEPFQLFHKIRPWSIREFIILVAHI